MALLHQVRLLSWKNGWTLLRKPVLPIAIVVWPCILFTVIAILRTQSPPHLISVCYMPPKTMPSGGFFPFIQSVICDATPVCQNTSTLPKSTTSRSMQYVDTRPNEATVLEAMKMVQFHLETLDEEIPKLQQNMDHMQRQLVVNNAPAYSEYPALLKYLSQGALGRVLSFGNFSTSDLILAENMKVMCCSQLTGMIGNGTVAMQSMFNSSNLQYFTSNVLPYINSTMQSWCNGDQPLLAQAVNTLNNTVANLDINNLMINMFFSSNNSILTDIEYGIESLVMAHKRSENLWPGLCQASPTVLTLSQRGAWGSLENVTISLKNITTCPATHWRAIWT